MSHEPGRTLHRLDPLEPFLREHLAGFHEPLDRDLVFNTWVVGKERLDALNRCYALH